MQWHSPTDAIICDCDHGPGKATRQTAARTLKTGWTSAVRLALNN